MVRLGNSACPVFFSINTLFLILSHLSLLCVVINLPAHSYARMRGRNWRISQTDPLSVCNGLSVKEVVSGPNWHNSVVHFSLWTTAGTCMSY